MSPDEGPQILGRGRLHVGVAGSAQGGHEHRGFGDPYPRVLGRLATVDLLILDDWLLAPLTPPEARCLTEVIGDRSTTGSTQPATRGELALFHGRSNRG